MRWPEETLERHSQSFSEGFRYTNGFLGTDCTGAIKVARSHQQRSSSLLKNRESVKLKESAENAKPRPMGHQQLPTSFNVHRLVQPLNASNFRSYICQNTIIYMAITVLCIGATILNAILNFSKCSMVIR